MLVFLASDYVLQLTFASTGCSGVLNGLSIAVPTSLVLRRVLGQSVLFRAVLLTQPLVPKTFGFLGSAKQQGWEWPGPLSRKGLAR